MIKLWNNRRDKIIVDETDAETWSKIDVTSFPDGSDEITFVKDALSELHDALADNDRLNHPMLKQFEKWKGKAIKKIEAARSYMEQSEVLRNTPFPPWIGLEFYQVSKNPVVVMFEASAPPSLNSSDTIVRRDAYAHI